MHFFSSIRLEIIIGTRFTRAWEIRSSFRKKLTTKLMRCAKMTIYDQYILIITSKIFFFSIIRRFISISNYI